MPNNSTFCLSTTTSGFVVEIGSLPVTDDQGNSYFATTSCPAEVITYNYVMDNPSQDMWNAIVLMLAMMFFVSWYWLNRLKST